MCTVSLIRPLIGSPQECSGGEPLTLRMVVNRDELTSRRVALPPTVVRSALGWAVMPIDADGGGTWTAATDHGLVMALLNGPVGPTQASPTGLVSRGLVIPKLLGASSLEEVLERVRMLPLERFLPWRLIAADGARVLDVELRAGARLRHLKSLQPLRMMATSSSTRSAEASERRRQAFREIVAPVDERTQDRFHASAFEDDSVISVTMERDDARTVSRTIVEVRASEVTMHYEPLVRGGLAGTRVSRRLGRSMVREGAA